MGFNTKQLPNLNLLGGPRDKLLLSGDPRVNVQPGLICLHTLWAREHNLVCDELKKQQDLVRYDDENLFQHARTITRAKWQAIVWYEFLPTVIGVEEFRKIPRFLLFFAFHYITDRPTDRPTDRHFFTTRPPIMAHTLLHESSDSLLNF